MLCLAAVSAIFVYRFVADKRGLGARLQNLCLFNAVASIMVGYYSAVLFQAFYNIPKYGEFRIDSKTGATFYAPEMPLHRMSFLGRPHAKNTDFGKPKLLDVVSVKERLPETKISGQGLFMR